MTYQYYCIIADDKLVLGLVKDHYKLAMYGEHIKLEGRYHYDEHSRSYILHSTESGCESCTFEDLKRLIDKGEVYRQYSDTERVKMSLKGYGFKYQTPAGFFKDIN